jgi:hypothetical protein
VSIDYRNLREQNAAALATLKAEMAEHIARNPGLLVEQCRRLAEQAKTTVVERSARQLGIVNKRRDNALVDETTDDKWNSWWDERFISTFQDCWPAMLEKMMQHFEAANEGLRREVAELRAELRKHVHTNNDI